MVELRQHNAAVSELVFAPEPFHCRLFSAAVDGSVCMYDTLRGYQPLRTMAAALSSPAALRTPLERRGGTSQSQPPARTTGLSTVASTVTARTTGSSTVASTGTTGLSTVSSTAVRRSLAVCAARPLLALLDPDGCGVEVVDWSGACTGAAGSAQWLRVHRLSLDPRVLEAFITSATACSSSSAPSPPHVHSGEAETITTERSLNGLLAPPSGLLAPPSGLLAPPSGPQPSATPVIASVVFSRDGGELLLITKGRVVARVDVDSGELVDLNCLSWDAEDHSGLHSSSLPVTLSSLFLTSSFLFFFGYPRSLFLPSSFFLPFFLSSFLSFFLFFIGAGK